MPTETPSDADAPLRNSLRGLLGGTVRVEDDDLPVAGAWIDPGAMALRYVGARRGRLARPARGPGLPRGGSCGRMRASRRAGAPR